MNGMDFLRGACVGIVAGTTLNMALSSNKRKMKRTKKRAVQAANEIAQNVGDILGL